MALDRTLEFLHFRTIREWRDGSTGLSLWCRAGTPRIIDDRSHGALRLWRRQIALYDPQVAILIATLTLRIGKI